jgi:hypothetical protein
MIPLQLFSLMYQSNPHTKSSWYPYFLLEFAKMGRLMLVKSIVQKQKPGKERTGKVAYRAQ